MKLTKENLSIVNYVRSARNRFEEVVKSHDDANRIDIVFSILNYASIMQSIGDYLEGYVDYKVKGSKKYNGKVFSSTVAFYNSMFTDRKKYRTKMRLGEMSLMMEEFLEQSKRVKDFMEKHLHETAIDPEFKALIELTDNQIRKIAKVNRDDLELYMWICFKDTFKAAEYEVPARLRLAFRDTSTPVMHVYMPGQPL